MGESTKNQHPKGKGHKAQKPAKKKQKPKKSERVKAAQVKHKAFVFEYLKNGQIGYLAYTKIYPGVSQRVAESNASRLLRNAEVISMIDKEIDRAFKEEQITIDYIVGGLKDVAEKCSQRRKIKHVQIVTENNESGKEETKVIETLVTGGFNPKEANSAYDKLGKFRRLRTDGDKDKDKEPTVNNIHIHLPDNNRGQIEPIKE